MKAISCAIDPVHDERGLAAYARWFDLDHAARFILAADGTVYARNQAACGLIDRGIVRFDGRHRPFLTLDSKAEFAGLLGFAHRNGADLGHRSGPTNGGGRDDDNPIRKAFCLSPGQWLIVSVRHEAELCLTYVGMREVGLDEDFDLEAIADRFCISPSERPVLQGVARAICPKDMARQLGISVHTVRAHLRTIYAKMGTRSSSETQKIISRVCLIVENT